MIKPSAGGPGRSMYRDVGGTERKKPFTSRPICPVLVLALVLAFSGFYALENWRGNWLWKKYRKALQAQGISLEPPPPSQSALRDSKERQTPYEREFDEVDRDIELAGSLIYDNSPVWPDLPFVDLVAWKQAFDLIKSGNTNQSRTLELIRAGKLKLETGNTNRVARADAAAGVLDGFAAQDRFLEKLHSACRRPELIYPFGHGGSPPDGPVPKVITAICLCQQLRVRTSAEFAAGKTKQALRNLELMLCLSESLRREPWLIGGIGAVACRNIALKSPWEGLAERRFTEPELQQLQELLGSEDLIADVPRLLRYERAEMLRYLEGLEQTRKLDSFISRPTYAPLPERLGYEALATVFRSMPDGWIQLDKLNYCESIDQIIAGGGFGETTKRIQPAALDQACGRVQKQLAQQKFRALLKHTVISRWVTPRVNDWALSSTAAQVTTDQMRLACGLERYYLKHGSYPETLEQIVPEFLAKLPADPISGTPYRYGRDKNGRYKIWSVGWNERDDGGVPGPQRYDKSLDWVWRYPAD